MVKQMMQANYIMRSAARFIGEQQQVRGDLTTAQAPVGLIVFDLLRAIGVPMNGLEMLLGSEFVESIDPVAFNTSFQDEFKCNLCEETARKMVCTCGGNHMLVCHRCATDLEKFGATVVL